MNKNIILEIQSLRLRQIVDKSNLDTSNDVIIKLNNDWNKKYKKYSHLLYKLMSDNPDTSLSELLTIIDKIDPYYNSSSLASEIGLHYNEILLTLEDLKQFVRSLELKKEFTDQDKTSLQEILNIWNKQKTFSCKHFDILEANENFTLVKPKTAKGSVAWSMSDAQGNLERYGQNYYDLNRKVEWCTAVYSADDKSSNLFNSYYLKDLTSLYYIIRNKNYNINDKLRRICIGIKDNLDQIDFDSSSTVNADNTIYLSLEDLQNDLSKIEEFDNQIQNLIYNDERDISLKRNLVIPTKEKIKTAISLRFKSFEAKTFLQTCIFTIEDYNLILYTLDLFVKSYINQRNSQDINFMIDLVDPLLEKSNGSFSKEALNIIKSAIRLKIEDLNDAFVSRIKEIIIDYDDFFDKSLLDVINELSNSFKTSYTSNDLKDILEHLDLNSTKIDLDDIEKSKSFLKDQVDLISNISRRALSTDPSVLQHLLESKVYELDIYAINAKILLNVNIFSLDLGKSLVEEIYFKKSNIAKYFSTCYTQILANENINEYDKVYQLISSFVNDTIFTYISLENIVNNKITRLTQDQINNYVSLAYSIYESVNDEHANLIIELIEDNFDEEIYSDLSP